MKKLLLISLALLLSVIAIVYLSMNSTPDNHETSVVVSNENIESIDFRKLDSVTVIANTLYKGNDLKEVVQGEQYRDVWLTPIKVPVVFLDTLFGGLEIVEEGGGKQTKSLELESKNGTIYTLRSIVKDPNPLVPEWAKTLGLENIVNDGISGQHPYAAIVVAAMAEALEILHTNPKIVFVPNQETFGKYNNEYGNGLYMLEYESEGEINWTPYNNVQEIIDTDDLLELKQKNPEALTINENILVRNRLFDILIGDWDRHAKQWGWVIQQREENLMAIPLPADRDNAFFNVDGILPSIISNPNVVEQLRPFEREIDFLPGLVQPFDRYFLLKTKAEVFEEEAKYLENNLTDEIIEKSLKLWPEEIYNLNGKEIAEKIKSRRNNLKEIAKKFKEIIVEKGPLTEKLKGTNDLELSENEMKCFGC